MKDRYRIHYKNNEGHNGLFITNAFDICEAWNSVIKVFGDITCTGFRMIKKPPHTT